MISLIKAISSLTLLAILPPAPQPKVKINPDSSLKIKIGILRTRSDDIVDQMIKLINSDYPPYYAEAIERDGIDFNRLKPYQIVILPSEWANANPYNVKIFDPKYAPGFHQFIEAGGGLLCSQPNPQGLDDFTSKMLPYPLAIRSGYDRREICTDCHPPLELAAEKVLDHFLTRNAPQQELPLPLDAITVTDSHWTVLARGTVSHSPSLLVARYGQGKAVVETEGWLFDRHPQYFIKIIEWLADNSPPQIIVKVDQNKIKLDEHRAILFRPKIIVTDNRDPRPRFQVEIAANQDGYQSKYKDGRAWIKFDQSPQKPLVIILKITAWDKVENTSSKRLFLPIKI